MYLEPSDLEMFADIDEAKAQAMIDDAEASAVMVAPCLADPAFMADPAMRAAVKAILRGAVLRWNDAGSGALSAHTQTAGPFSNAETYDTRQQRRGMFWPSEIAQLQELCGRFAGSKAGAFTVDTLSHLGHGVHADVCSIRWGASCSCGSIINSHEHPLYEGGLIS